jgi:hypothetical protein
MSSVSAASKKEAAVFFFFGFCFVNYLLILLKQLANMCIDTIKCRFNYHDWIVEFYKVDDYTRFPAFRICKNCGKYEQPGVSSLVVEWISSEDSVELSIVKSKVLYEQKLISKTYQNENTKKDR